MMNKCVNFPLSEERRKEAEAEPTIEELRDRGMNEIAIWEYCIEHDIPISVGELDLTDREKRELVKRSSLVDFRQLFTNDEILAIWEENESFKATEANEEAMERCRKVQDAALSMQKYSRYISKVSCYMGRDSRNGSVRIDIDKTCDFRGKDMDLIREMMNLSDTFAISYVDADDPERDPNFTPDSIRISFSVFDIWR